ncbi:MAG: ATP-binding domain-containing protein [Myxococcales bacterium]|nr:ATP-binding domain-containing protein [Myxococcales bacterium]
MPSPELGLPPPTPTGGDVAQYLEDWEAALDDAIATCREVKTALLDRRERLDRAAKLAGLQDELAVARARETASGEPAAAELHFAVFLAACRVRAAWAVVNAEPLRSALARALDSLAERRGLRRLIDDDVDAGDWLLQLFPVLGSTLLSLGNVLAPAPRCIDRLVIDEAGQCHPAYAVSGLLRARQALLIGDVHQLEPVIRLARDDEARLRRAARIMVRNVRLGPFRVVEGGTSSAQALADQAVATRPTLRDHFRCQAPIIGLSDALCGYALRVRTPPPSGPSPLPGPVLMVPVNGEQTRQRGSWHNPVEAQAVLALLDGLIRGGVEWGQIAVITPYVGQLDALREALRRARVPLEATGAADALDLFDGAGLATGTVHRFQGGERRVVIFSTVITRPRSLGFLNARVNLVNVAVSRAREHLVVVGDPTVLRQGRFTRLLVERAAPLRIGPGAV